MSFEDIELPEEEAAEDSAPGKFDKFSTTHSPVELLQQGSVLKYYFSGFIAAISESLRTLSKICTLLIMPLNP